ncbi:hypothetical protein M378DRAFT_171053 [Amanita muscaria Koide BX008]|uniref:Uncharacterized protein n=1 Tax=Amanita muscaria (strain Koide BX008) TaxID=946122 RepID=A0A0C2WA41_AMAMK|nr:hypothetical protein M378DRAFT_171053 [Amanita muscaria Koide BX008]
MRPWSWTSRTPPFTGHVKIDCRHPTLIKPWYIQTFRPRWFGMFGGPNSLTYQTKGPKAHQISIVDIDKRDVPGFRLQLDGKDLGFQTVELDDSIDCGIDEGRCMVLGFASTKIIVPPGKHVVKAEIADRE